MKISQAIADLEKISSKQYVHLICAGVGKQAAEQFTQTLMAAAVEQKIVLLDASMTNSDATVMQIKMLTNFNYEIDEIPTYEVAKKLIANYIVKQKPDSIFFDEYFKESYQNIFKEIARAKRETTNGTIQ